MTSLKSFLLLLAILSTFTLNTVGQDLTTLVLVRHAEKVNDGSRDPSLSRQGSERAIKLAALLDDTHITALYSTPFKRTMRTAAPLAEQKNLKVNIYDPYDSDFLSNMITKEKGGTIVIFGHSNTTPRYANELLGEERFEKFGENDYGNIIIITIADSKESKLLHLRY